MRGLGFRDHRFFGVFMALKRLICIYRFDCFRSEVSGLRDFRGFAFEDPGFLAVSGALAFKPRDCKLLYNKYYIYSTT